MDGDPSRRPEGFLCKGRRDRPRDAAAAVGPRHIEPAHAQGGRLCCGGFHGDPADSGQFAIHEGGQKRLALTIEALSAARPVNGQPVHVAMALGGRLRAQRVEPLRQVVEDPDELDHQPGEIIFSGRTRASNSSLVT
jgi:hypothetical protein